MIKNLIFILLIMFGMSACLQINPTKDSVTKKHVTYISPELRPIVEDYLKVMSGANVDISRYNKIDSILLVDSAKIICNTDGAIGCSFQGVVQIKKTGQYYFFGDEYLKVMIYHEMGHELLSLPHSNFYSHIMFPIIHENILFYTFNWDKLLKSYINYIKYCTENDYLIQH